MHESRQLDTESAAAHASRGNGFLVGLACGAAVGAVVGLILAPKPGSELRHQLADSASRLRKKAAETYGDASHTISDVVTRSRHAFAVGREAFQSARPATDAAEGVMSDPTRS